MVCYARPAGSLAVIITVAALVLSRPFSHISDTATFVAAVTAATAVAAVAAALVFAAFMSVRRRRAAAGGCVGCQFRCQHAMTEQSQRLWLVSTMDRRPQAPASGHPAATAGRPAPVPGHPRRPLLPIQPVAPMPVRDKGLKDLECDAGSAPRWPDRPIRRASPPASQRERVGANA